LGLRDVFRTDLTILHAPQVFDFRKELILAGPMADAVPSTDQFEMYPAGITSIASYLAKNNYNVRIINLAYRMLRDPNYNAVGRLKQLNSTVFGVDLHWLPHAQGALAVAELVKRLHPESYTLLGGLSSSYYHEELIKYPFVDFVLRGDSTEEPCRQLLQALREKGSLESVENLTWKKPDGGVVVNPLTFIPPNLDYIDIPDYIYAIKAVFKYMSIEDMIPFLDWFEHPTTMLLNSRGCTLNCSTCGGALSAYKIATERPWPAFRSPEKLMHDIRAIRKFSQGPIFLIHDPRIGGMERAQKFFSLLQKEQMPNEFVVELFFPAGDEFFAMIQRSVARWRVQITIETDDERLRKLDNLKFPVPNEKIEGTIESALAHGCRRLDLFFMVGIPHQTYEDVMATVPYCEQLMKRFGDDNRLGFFVSPMGPFLDPGSPAFEDPKFGYRHFYRTLEEHRQALLTHTWKSILSYETDAMSREQILAASYDVAEALNELKLRHGLIDKTTFDQVKSHQVAARRAMVLIEQAMRLPEDERQNAMERIRKDINEANVDSMFSKDELHWKGDASLRLSPSFLKVLPEGLMEEVVHGIHRLIGAYDTSVYPGPRVAAANLGNNSLPR
jgi:B12-binding domain/radical SAM domain protein